MLKLKKSARENKNKYLFVTGKMSHMLKSNKIWPHIFLWLAKNKYLFSDLSIGLKMYIMNVQYCIFILPIITRLDTCFPAKTKNSITDAFKNVLSKTQMIARCQFKNSYYHGYIPISFFELVCSQKVIWTEEPYSVFQTVSQTPLSISHDGRRVK